MKKVLFISIIAAFSLGACGEKSCKKSDVVAADSLKQEIQKTEQDIQTLDKTSQELDTASVKLDEALKEIQ